MTILNPKLLEEINVAAYFLAQEGHPYDTLCWMLAERRLQYKSQSEAVPHHLVKCNAADIYFSCCDYNIMCWLIAEIEILMKYNIFDKKI